MKQEVFPSRLVASFFRFQPAEFFNVAEPERIVPRVNLTLPA
jgi:hypothetical protein